MIETEQTVTVHCDIDSTWTFAKDFQRWASIMPGYQSCEMEDEDNSLWVLKVGVGGMVRTVKVKVHVVEWAGPGRVDFTYKLMGDPVEGSGAYLAAPTGDNQTAMTLKIKIVGSGPLAPMWEAMCGPVLPKFARAFAEQLKGRIEEFNGASDLAGSAPVRSVKPGLLARLMAWLRALFGRA